jgi:Fe-S cluster biogenesis protein NfuA
MLHVIDVELTPNPQALKFILNDKLLRYESRQFGKKDDAQNDPLARGIFEIDGVVSVFYMDKFVTIEKAKATDWGKIQRPFVNFITTFNKNDIPAETVPKGTDEKSDELLKKINEILNLKVRPALAFDGGGLEILGLTGYTLRLKYQGACGSCPSSINGTLSAIESVLKRDVNPAIEVVAD